MFATESMLPASSNLPFGVEIDLNKHVYHRKKHLENVDPIPDHVIANIKHCASRNTHTGLSVDELAQELMAIKVSNDQLL
jgi:hypothetical protein